MGGKRIKGLKARMGSFRRFTLGFISDAFLARSNSDAISILRI